MSNSPAATDSTPPKRNRRGWVIIAVILVLALLGGLFVSLYISGKSRIPWGASAGLRALFEDPMASPDILGLKLVSSEHTPTQLPWEKPPPSFVRNCFDISGQDPEVVVKEASMEALELGWSSVDSLGEPPYLWFGEKQIEIRTADGLPTTPAAIVIQTSDNYTCPAGQLRVSLFYR